jgi:hypothetical protein
MRCLKQDLGQSFGEKNKENLICLYKVGSLSSLEKTACSLVDIGFAIRHVFWEIIGCLEK